MANRRMTTEQWLDQPIENLTREELTARKARLDRLMDDTTSPKWYMVVCEKWREVRTAIATKYPAAMELLEGRTTPTSH